jgi:hypothetical protein
MLPGITDLRDLPYTYVDAITAGLAFLAYEELPDDERPAQNIWFDSKMMDKHWKAVKKAREAKWGSDKGIADEEIDDAVSNKTDINEYLGVKD